MEPGPRFHTAARRMVPPGAPASPQSQQKGSDRKNRRRLLANRCSQAAPPRAQGRARQRRPHGLLTQVLALFYVPPHAERISLSVVRGVNRAIRSHLATLSARLARA